MGTTQAPTTVATTTAAPETTTTVTTTKYTTKDCTQTTAAPTTEAPTTEAPATTQAPQPSGGECDASCTNCVAIPGNFQAASDEACSACGANGQTWWPCNQEALCQCASRILADIIV